MRKFFTFILIIINMIIYAETKKNNYNLNNFRHINHENYYDGKIYFHEDGIEFTIKTNGFFNFNINNKLNRYNRNFPIVRDFHGNITQIGETPIRYNLRGKVRRIGTVRVRYYDNGLIRKVGNLRVVYESNGTPTFKGYINRLNKNSYSRNNYRKYDKNYRRFKNRTRVINNRKRRS